jgi:hypothetical protein
MVCPCNIVGLLSMNYSGIISASFNGNTEVGIATDGTVLLGQTMNTLTISAWPFAPGGDRFLGASCPASANASIRWLQKYDCVADTTHFIPQSAGRASITNGPITGVSLDCDPNVSSLSFSASAQGGPTTPYITSTRKDGFNLEYTGLPISIQSGVVQSYDINLGPFSVTAYLQSFSLNVTPPSPAVVNYSFVVPGTVD